MGLFSKLFKKKNTPATNIVAKALSPECQTLLAHKTQMDALLQADRYVARSEYLQLLLDAQKTIEYFGVLKRSNMLGSFCRENGIDISVVEATAVEHDNFTNLIEAHNENYIQQAMRSEKHYLDTIVH